MSAHPVWDMVGFRTTKTRNCLSFPTGLRCSAMPDTLPPSEFGGKSNALGIQPHPHKPNEFERLRSIYLTGNEDGTDLPQHTNHEAFVGLLPEEEQRAIMEEKGAFEKGQIWEEWEG